eukprot:gb/GEZN01000595.1/.p1 GENE.gb/GEZN01000595.1/~~gb/GEZN01000595.1/.p1  ORF type:complete len:1181 (-),score=269.69 gb/GEZN01000595.1/:514-4008(-)
MPRQSDDYEVLSCHPAALGVFPREQKVFRVFVSSTFQDYAAERNYFTQHVWPQVRGFCQRYGWSFMTVDMRWGIRDESTDDHRTVQICLEEIERARNVSPGLNFLLLMGNRCGWRPLPPVLPSRVFLLLEPLLPAPLLPLLNKWYQVDLNNLPPLYKLVALSDSTRQQFWSKDSPALTPAVRQAATQLYADKKISYEEFALCNASVTEQEILKGVFSGVDHLPIVFQRDIQGLDLSVEQKQESKAAGAFFDLAPDGSMDQEAKQLVKQLKDRVWHKVPPARKHQCVCTWDATTHSISTEHLAEQAKVLTQEMLRMAANQMENYTEPSEQQSYEEQQRRTSRSLGGVLWGDWNSAALLPLAQCLHFPALTDKQQEQQEQQEQQAAGAGRLFVLASSSLASRAMAHFALQQQQTSSTSMVAAGTQPSASSPSSPSVSPAPAVLVHFLPKYKESHQKNHTHRWGVPLVEQLQALLTDLNTNKHWQQSVSAVAMDGEEKDEAAAEWPRPTAKQTAQAKEYHDNVKQLQNDLSALPKILSGLLSELAEFKQPILVLLCDAMEGDLEQWPWPLPCNVNVVCSVSGSLRVPTCAAAAAAASPSSVCLVHLPVLTASHVAAFAQAELARMGRTLQPNQLQALLALLQTQSSAAASSQATSSTASDAAKQQQDSSEQDKERKDSDGQEELVGRTEVALLQAAEWSSSDGLTRISEIGTSMRHSLTALLLKLERYHGSLLVGDCLSLLHLARVTGLPESALQQALSLDQELLRSISQYHQATELPASVFTRLLADLTPYLQTTNQRGYEFLKLRHPQLGDLVAERYLSPSAATTATITATTAAVTVSVKLNRILAQVLLPLCNAPVETVNCLQSLQQQTEPAAESKTSLQQTQQQAAAETKTEEPDAQVQQEQGTEDGVRVAQAWPWSGASQELLRLLVDVLLAGKEWLCLEAMLCDIRYLSARFDPNAIHADVLRACRTARQQETVLNDVELLGTYLMGDYQGMGSYVMYPWEAMPEWYPQLDSLAPFRHRGSNVIHYVLFPNNPSAAPTIFNKQLGYKMSGWHCFDQPFFAMNVNISYASFRQWTRQHNDNRQYQRHMHPLPSAGGARPGANSGRPGQGNQGGRPNPQVNAATATQTIPAPHPPQLRVFKPFPGPTGFSSHFRAFTRMIHDT